MKVLPSSVRVGNVIKEKGKLWAIVRMSHTQPGKGGAFFQLELRNVEDQTKQTKRVRANEELERADLFEKKATYLYQESDGYVFMDSETYEQVHVSKEMAGSPAVFLYEGMAVTLTVYETQIIGIIFPKSVKVKVSMADAVVKGQTATSSYKNATLENGVEIKVPQHITADTDILVDPTTNEYLEKA